MKAPTHTNKQDRSNRIDISKVFADRPFNEFSEKELKYPTSVSPKRKTIRTAILPMELIHQF